MPTPPLSLGRKLAYSALLVSTTVLLLFVSLETGLRLAGYGYSPHFVRQETLPNGEKIWRENRWVTAPYFSPALVRRPLPFRLPEKKAPGTYRIFVLGSSAAMGDPEPSFSMGRMLETLLRAAYPERRFEVVNAAITAINSHLVRGIAHDCARLEPDLFIVYEGNNEVIGPFGPAGVFAPFIRSEAAVRAAVWFKGTRTAQLISAAARKLRGSTTAPEGWGGMGMFLKQQFAADDPRLSAVRDHFRANLQAIAASARKASARTLVCTVLTNQRDFAPFLSQHRQGISPADLAQWKTHVQAAKIAERAEKLDDAEKEYRAALAIDNDYAETVFRLGRLMLQEGKDAEADTLLGRARDLDTLRFRTDRGLNDVVRSLAGQPGGSLEVADLAADLARKSPHGSIGDELLYEHVHLTLRGAYEVARELFPRIVADLARKGLAPAAVPSPIDYSEARLRLGFTTHEQAMIAIELLNRFRGPPFNAQADHAFRIRTWEHRVETANALLARSDALPALREIYRQALVHSPDDWILERNAGAMFVARQSPAEAVPLLQRAAAWIDDDVDTLVPLGWAQRQTGHAAEAQATFARARELEPHYPGLPKD